MITKSIMVTYLAFQTLPKGIKQMLLASESHFFDAANGARDPRPATFAAIIGGMGEIQRVVQTLNPRKLSDDIMNGAHFYKTIVDGITASPSKI
jgi:hypothetical protein